MEEAAIAAPPAGADGVKSTYPYCGVGCGVLATVAADGSHGVGGLGCRSWIRVSQPQLANRHVFALGRFQRQLGGLNLRCGEQREIVSTIFEAIAGFKSQVVALRTLHCDCSPVAGCVRDEDSSTC